MKNLIFNPYLPQGEYFPDGEPHVFGGRVYVYASHDRYNSTRYCTGDYVVWSAPLDDLSSWTNKGVAYRRRGVRNRLGSRCMWAPDCAQGADGRYYLYYCFGFDDRVCVAVSSEPDIGFQFYGYVHYPDGTLYGKGKNDIMSFDPAIFVDDDGETYLYSGFSVNEGMRKILRLMGHKNVDGTGGQAVRLEKDMLTVKGEPVMLIPGYKNSKGTGFEGHEMYEASSMRKVNGKYYFVYSSILSHELAYAISDYPDKDFKYGGSIISNGDIGFHGLKEADAKYYWGNNHGSIVDINGEWYVFYHRQTNKTEQSRQGCAERIEIASDGSIKQVEMTSQGLYGKPLPGQGTYHAYIACNLQSKSGAVKCAYGPGSKHKYSEHPCIAEYSKHKQYIKGLRNGATAGFQYFLFEGTTVISVTVRGSKGNLLVRTKKDGETVGKIAIESAGKWSQFTADINLPKGVSAVYFTYEGDGYIDLLSFSLETVITKAL